MMEGKKLFGALSELSDSIKQSEEKELNSTEAKKINQEINNFISVSNKLIALLKTYGGKDKFIDALNNTVDAFQNHFLKYIDIQESKLISLSDGIFEKVKDNTKKELEALINKSKIITEDEKKIAEKFIKQINDLKDNLVKDVYVKKSFNVVNSQEVDYKLALLEKYFLRNQGEK